MHSVRAEFDVEDFPAGGYRITSAEICARVPVTAVCVELSDGTRVQARKVTQLEPAEAYFNPLVFRRFDWYYEEPPCPLFKSDGYSWYVADPASEDA